MLTRLIRIQLVLFTALTLVALITLGWYYLRLPSVAGIGQYTLTADLPSSGGLYRDRQRHLPRYHDRQGHRRRAHRDAGPRRRCGISDNFKIPVNAIANVHSVSAIGEQYLDLVATGNSDQYFAPGRRITEGTVPREIGPALDAANNGLAVLPKEKIAVHCSTRHRWP